MTWEKIRKYVEKCVKCGKCVAKCPSSNASDDGTPNWEIFNPRGRMRIINGIINEQIPINDKAIEGIFSCFICNQCVVTCPSLVEITESIIEIRKAIVSKDDAPKCLTEPIEIIEQSENLFDMDQEERVELWSMDVEDLIDGRIDKPAEILYFIGCQASFKGSLASIPTNVVKILVKLNIDFTILGEKEVCCGDPMFLVGGADDKLKTLAEKNVNAIEALGIKKVIFTCPGCYRMFKTVYPNLLEKKLSFQPLMISEFFMELMDAGILKLERVDGLGRVTYHDPCELGRHLGIYEPPRKILQNVPNVDFVEFLNNKENSNCCGMGGGVAFCHQKFTKNQARNKARDIKDVKANTVVTHCPACFQGITNSAELLMQEGIDVKVLDLVELVAKALGLDE
ncbi:MAG: (Fe-S)-binding protein [Promethearchaeota archaeon]